jgi:cytochrome c-type biogenesis protein CcmH/NrfG
MGPPDDFIEMARRAEGVASRRAPSEADVADAWAEVDRLRRLALAVASEAAERRRLTGACRGDPFHPRALGLAAAADFHEGRAAQAAERARGAARLAAELQARLESTRGAVRCA